MINKITYLGWPGLKKNLQKPNVLTSSASILIADEIVSAISKYYGIDSEQLKQNTRQGHIAWARHLSMYLIRNRTSLSLVQIGKYFNRDHTSVIHAVRRVATMIKMPNEIAWQKDYINIISIL